MTTERVADFLHNKGCSAEDVNGTGKKVAEGALIGTVGVAGSLGIAGISYGAVELGKVLVVSGVTVAGAGAVVTSVAVGAVGVGLILGGAVVGVMGVRKYLSDTARSLGEANSNIKDKESKLEDIVNLDSEYDSVSFSEDNAEKPRDKPAPYRDDEEIFLDEQEIPLGKPKLVINHTDKATEPAASYVAQVTSGVVLERK